MLKRVEGLAYVRADAKECERVGKEVEVGWILYVPIHRSDPDPGNKR